MGLGQLTGPESDWLAAEPEPDVLWTTFKSRQGKTKMKNETGKSVVNALRTLSVAAWLMAFAAPAVAECDTDRSFCANYCTTAKRRADDHASLAELTAYSDEQRAEAKQEAAALRMEAREEYKICLNNCDAEYNACAGRRVNEDYDD